MPGVQVVLDAQVLQTSGARHEPARRRVAAWMEALGRSGRLAAALVAPEQPAPYGPGPYRWDCLATARRLAAAGVVRLVAEPFLHLEPGAPAARVVNPYWAQLGVLTAVFVADPEALASDDERQRARAWWVCSADLLLTAGGEARSRILEVSGRPAMDVVDVGGGPDWDAVAARTSLALDRLAAATPARACRVPARVALVGPFPPGGGGIGAYNARLVACLAGRVDAAAVAAEWTSWEPPRPAEKLHVESFGADVRPASYDAAIYTLGNSDGHLATVEAALRHPGWLWLHETRLPAVATSALSGLADEDFWARLACLLERAYPGRAPHPAARAAGRDHLALARGGVGLTSPLVERAAGVIVNSTAARHSLLLDLEPLAWHPPVHVVPPACPPLRDRSRSQPEERLVGSFGVVSMSKRPDLLVDAAALGGFRLVFVGPCPGVLAQMIAERAALRGVGGMVEVTGAVDDDQWWSWMERVSLAVQLREISSGELSAAVLDELSAGVAVVTNLPAAAGYPVSRLGGSGAEDIAGRVDRLLGAPAEREELARGGYEFAARHQAEDLVEVLLSVVGA